jgi:uncharacterized repeat protein (TIGR01451 family)
MELELTAREAGLMHIAAVAVADGGLRAESAHDVRVRRAQLEVAVSGPQRKFAGARATYQIRLANKGDAAAEGVTLQAILPAGARCVGGADGSQPASGGLLWKPGDLSPGAQRAFAVECELLAAGQNRLEVRTQSQDGLTAADSCVTAVEAVADLKLNVNDPRGPATVGEEVVYDVQIANRGTKAARNITVVAQFSDGIEPTAAAGHRAELVPGQVLFAPIGEIAPGQGLTLKITARGQKSGSLRFRVEVKCADPETHLVSEESTQFFADGTEDGARAMNNEE